MEEQDSLLITHTMGNPLSSIRSLPPAPNELCHVEGWQLMNLMNFKHTIYRTKVNHHPFR